MRAFIAIGISTETKKKLKRIQQDLEILPVKAKWVASNKFHITLKFFQDIEKRQIEKIKKVIVDAASQYSFFDVYLKDFGFFPNSKKPRVFFVSSHSGQILEKIAQDLEEKLEKIDFPKENKFRPHITLARIKSLKNIHQLTKKVSDLEIKGKFQVRKISLYKSTLTPQGPIYTEIFKSSLKR